MANASTGFWSALGAVFGGVAGAFAGKYATEFRPRSRAGRVRPSYQDVEDAMVIGGSTGAVVGAFIAGATMGEPNQPKPVAQLTK